MNSIKKKEKKMLVKRLSEFFFSIFFEMQKLFTD